MRAADQWAQIEDTLAAGWSEARLAFAPEGSMPEAASALAPLQPIRVGAEFRFHVMRSEGGAERTRNTMRRLDANRVWGLLTLIGVTESETAQTPVTASAPATTPASPRALADAWDEAVSTLPSDWSDLLCELELDSSAQVPRAALLGAPLNPSRVPDEVALRFRASGKQGYGVSPQMARRCFERMDAERITGRITILNGLSDTENAVTQGPVWRVAGRSV
jgi:hypothetical protein